VNLIAARGLRRAFAGLPVLAGVDLDVAPGDVVAILGPNGAGKTTLLRILALLLRFDGGTLSLFGDDAHGRPAAAKRRLGWVGHESACYPDLTGRENLEFYAALHGVADGGGRVAELLAWSELAAAAARPVRTYSRGMLQRIALARALVHDPDVLLLDEPATGLDRRAEAALDARIAVERGRGHAVVLSTHDIERAAALATQVLVLHRGRIVWRGDASAGAAAVAAAYETATV
jgi:heme exporter protein A